MTVSAEFARLTIYGFSTYFGTKPQRKGLLLYQKKGRPNNQQIEIIKSAIKLELGDKQSLEMYWKITENRHLYTIKYGNKN